MEKGCKEESIKMVRIMTQLSVPTEVILKAIGLTIETIERL